MLDRSINNFDNDSNELVRRSLADTIKKHGQGATVLLELPIENYFMVNAASVKFLVDNGFEVLVSVVNPDFVDEKWLGHKIDQDFINYMRKLNTEEGINMAGDEFHSFVADCPLFKKRIEVVESKKVSKDGYSVLEISKAKLVPKDQNA